MVEKQLLEKMHSIFACRRTTFNAPNEEALEQETLFLRVNSSRPSIREGKEVYKIMGQAMVFSKVTKYPIGYFPKRVQSADLDDTKDLFFYDFEEAVPVFQDLVRRSFSFVYFFSGDYDPEHGTITSIEFQEGET